MLSEQNNQEQTMYNKITWRWPEKSNWPELCSTYGVPGNWTSTPSWWVNSSYTMHPDMRCHD